MAYPIEKRRKQLCVLYEKLAKEEIADKPPKSFAENRLEEFERTISEQFRQINNKLIFLME